MDLLPKKSLGQHFLLNPSSVEKILSLAKVDATDHIVEIGPGPGVMTRLLASIAARVVAIEKDRRFVQNLRANLEFPNLEIVEKDVLSVEWSQVLPPIHQKWKVVANLPYNIATEIIFRLLESRSLFASLTLMVQKEVGERLVAVPGNKDYGVLSILTQIFSESRIVMKLSPGAFTPPPKVSSVVVEFKISETCRFPINDLPLFKALVRAGFGQRRKMIRNALEKGMHGFTSERLLLALEKAEILPTARAETVPIEKWVSLANLLA